MATKISGQLHPKLTQIFATASLTALASFTAMSQPSYTLQCHNLSFFKSLKFKSEQGFHFFFVTQMSFRDGSRDSIFKIGKIFIILTI